MASMKHCSVSRGFHLALGPGSGKAAAFIGLHGFGLIPGAGSCCNRAGYASSDASSGRSVSAFEDLP